MLITPLLVTGSIEDNRVMGLCAPVVLDQGFSAGRQFGATGTPMAVPIDAQGGLPPTLLLAFANDPYQMKLLTA